LKYLERKTVQSMCWKKSLFLLQWYILFTHSQRLLRKTLLYHSHGQAMEFFIVRKTKIYFSPAAVNIGWTVWIRRKL